MKRLFVLFSVMLFATGCASQQQTRPGDYEEGVETETTTERTTISEKASYDGPKARIIVSDVECEASDCPRVRGDGMKTMLRSTLSRSNRFVVMVRGDELESLKEEIEFSQSEYVGRNQIQKGGMEGADIVVKGTLVAFEPNASGSNETGFGFPESIPVIGGMRISNKTAYVAMEIELIDVRQGRIVNATRVEGTSTEYKINGIGGGVRDSMILGPTFSEYRNTPMEKAIMVMMDRAVEQIGQLVPEDYYRYQPPGGS